MQANHPPPPDPTPARREASVVETMLDRPVAHIAKFCGQIGSTWLRGLVDPWGLGKTILEDPRKLVPPFAFLVIALFVSGVAMRLWQAMVAIPLSDESSFVDDLRFALGDVSLTQVTMVTLPCVLVVAFGVRLLSFALRGQEHLDADKVVTAGCYAAAWQTTMVTVIFALLVTLQMQGYDPAGSLRDEMNQVLMLLCFLVFAWGAMILAPAVRQRLPAGRWWTLPFSLVLSGVVITATLCGSLWTLGASIDLNSATRLRVERQQDRGIGDLHAYILQAESVEPESPEAPLRFKMTVAYSSRAKRVLIVPRHEGLSSPSGGLWSDLQAKSLRVVATSLDGQTGKSLVIQPGETRLIDYTVESMPESIGVSNEGASRRHKFAYAMPFLRRELDGLFTEGKAIMWTPYEIATGRLASEPSGEAIQR